MTFKILVPDNLNAASLEVLQREAEFDVVLGPFSREEALARSADADALIVRSATKVNAEFIAASPMLRVVARAGVGVDNIDVVAATARGIVVMNTPGANTIAATEHTFGLMLALARHIPEAQQSMREGRWDRKVYAGTELKGKVLGIIGLGRIGHAVAQRARAFEMTTIAYDPNLPEEDVRASGVEPATFEDVLARSDYIVLHAPANEDTKNMINAATIAAMKPGVRIINTARGTLVDAAALADAIKSGKVAGAAVDVYPVEPPAPDYPLVGLPGVIHTPHLGASTAEAQIAVAVQAAEAVRDALLYHKYANVVNPDVLKAVPGD
jgi:D-3-phosphoglycerate dehydrogenase